MGKENGLVRRAGEEKRVDSNNIHLRKPCKRNSASEDVTIGKLMEEKKFSLSDWLKP